MEVFAHKVWVERNTYRDSVTLMHLADRILKAPGVIDVAILMGTPANKERMVSAGFDDSVLKEARPGDLCVGVRTEGAEALDAALQVIRDFLSGKGQFIDGSGTHRGAKPRTLASAKRSLPGAQLAAISLPGEYAAQEAKKALEMDMHVFLFSDNVSGEEEKSLKRFARDRGLLLMGPDCGTALVNGFPLGFCNQVPRGPVGLVAASGTGAQEVICLLAQNGVGISHVLGTGGRDLSEEIGGITFEMAISALERDEQTKVVILVSKPPSMSVEARILEIARGLEKPVVISFVGQHGGNADEQGLYMAKNLEHAAQVGACLAKDEAVEDPLSFNQFVQQYRELLEAHKRGLRPEQQFVRGLYSGGTLADEAALILSNQLPKVHAGEGFGPVLPVKDWNSSTGNTIIDLGDDRFTIGRPHPMIDPATRIERLQSEIMDPSVAVVLLDVVLGYNADKNPAEKLAPAIREAHQAVTLAGRNLPVIVHICGTEDDRQDLLAQKQRFEDAGCVVFLSNVKASYAAAWIAGTREEDQTELGR